MNEFDAYPVKALWFYPLERHEDLDQLKVQMDLLKIVDKLAYYDFKEGRLDRSVYEDLKEMKPYQLKNCIKRYWEVH